MMVPVAFVHERAYAMPPTAGFCPHNATLISVPLP